MHFFLLLAAGSSSRMQSAGESRKTIQEGEVNMGPPTEPGTIPKMLLDFNGKTLLQHTIDEVNQIDKAKLLVVTGCYHAQLREILAAQQIEYTFNENWQMGMGASIQKGVSFILQNYPDAPGIIILVCDQPYLSAELLQELIDTNREAGKGIVGCSYNGTIGTPVLFDRKYFGELLNLSGDTGAKKIIRQHNEDTATVAFPLGAFDIDTPGDYKKLRST